MNTQIHFFFQRPRITHESLAGLTNLVFFFHIFSASKHLNGTEIKFASDTETKEKHRERESEV